MNPISFEGANRMLTQPKNWDEKEGTVGGLPVHADGKSFLSVWAPSDYERQLLAIDGFVAVQCYSVQMPIMLSAVKIEGEIKLWPTKKPAKSIFQLMVGLRTALVANLKEGAPYPDIIREADEMLKLHVGVLDERK